MRLTLKRGVSERRERARKVYDGKVVGARLVVESGRTVISTFATTERGRYVCIYFLWLGVSP